MNEKSIHVWWSNLDQPQNIVDNCHSFLSSEEKNRINKYNTQLLKNRQVMSKAILKKLLSLYLEKNVKEINFIYNNYGKPYIACDKVANSVKFNISHSENVGIFAFTLNDDLGVDIEKVKEYIEIDGIKEICFTNFEKEWYDNLNNEFKLEAFYKIWTIKEAFIKAIGEGFSYPTINLELTNESGNQIKIRKIYSKEYSNVNYKVNTFPSKSGFVSSVVYEGEKNVKIFPQLTFNELIN